MFEYHVNQYTQRKLTFDSDSLCAVQSVLDRFQHEQNSIEHMCGIPFKAIPNVVHTWDANANPNEEEYDFNILTDLAWTHGSTKRPIKRRAEFPSWSWAGWEGPVTWLIHDLRIEMDLDVDPDIFYRPAQVLDFAGAQYAPRKRWSKWRLRDGYDFPTVLEIDRDWLKVMVVKSGHEHATDATYHLAPLSYHEDQKSGKSSTSAWPQYMVHVTLTYEDAASACMTGEVCFGTDVIRDPQREIVYLLLACVTSRTIGGAEGVYERFGVAVVDLWWYNAQMTEKKSILLG